MLTAITIAMVANLAPPPRYDYEPHAPYHITYLPQSKLQKVCAEEVSSRRDTVLGCTMTDLGLIFVARGLEPDVNALIVKHEKAHLNGWPHRHEPVVASR